ncbi:MAG: cobalamin-binding protein [Firmicutes bacterium HGW-Firmicutes-11]|nr:MAG: cobalamin-binding protein [Firmicutes bacterium HGW-Firmicutes-11]
MDLAGLGREFESALLQINRVKAAELFERCYVNDNSFPLLERLAIDTLERIGEGWENGTVSLSQVYMSGVICEELIEQYLPKLLVKRKIVPRMAIGVLQDHHGLGKRIVCSVLRAGGFELIDYGQGLTVEELVHRSLEDKLEVLLISTLMLPSALKVKAVKEALAEAGAETKVIVGGAPFRLDGELWKRVGADAFGDSAASVVRIIEEKTKGGAM